MAESPTLLFSDALKTMERGLHSLKHLETYPLTKALGILFHAERVCVTGMGKSGHVARKVASTMASLGTLAYFVHPAEAGHGDLGMIGQDDAVLAFSWSGNTKELLPLLKHVKDEDRLIAVTSDELSLLGKAAHAVIKLPKCKEACPNGQAPTTSTLMQLAVGDALAVVLAHGIGFKEEDFRKLHPGGALGAT